MLLRIVFLIIALLFGTAALLFMMLCIQMLQYLERMWDGVAPVLPNITEDATAMLIYALLLLLLVVLNLFFERHCAKKARVDESKRSIDST